MLHAILACVGCALADPSTAAGGAVAVDVELVLAVDASRSMDENELALQRAGYAAALSDPAFAAAVRSGVHGRIALTYFEWSDDVHEASRVAWRIVDGPESAAAFAAAIPTGEPRRTLGTSISAALAHAAGLFEGNGFAGGRRVVDVSGDGPNNKGPAVDLARDALVADGIVVNGLPILISPSRTFHDLDRYYAECVAGGPGSFVLPANGIAEFATAIRRKLILEVSGVPPPPITVSLRGPVDCAKGERDDRFAPDPDLDGTDE